MAYVKNAIHLPLDSLLERNGYRLNAQKSTKIWKVYSNSNEKLLVRQNANFQWFYLNCDNKADSGNIINFCKNRNLDLMGFTQGLIINDDTIKENASKLTSADKFKEQQKIIDKFNQFELYDLTNSKMLEKRKLNGNLFLAYNHSLKRDKHNNMCVPNFLYSKNSHSNEIISYTRRLENPMTSLNNQVLNRPINALNKGEKGMEMLAPKDLKLIKNIVLSESIIDSMSYLQLRKLNAYESILLSCNGQFNANKLDAFLEKLLSDIEQSKSKEYADYLKKVQSFELYKGTQTRIENKTNTTRDNLTIHFSRAKYPSSTDFMPAKDWVNESVKSLDELVKVITNYHYSSAIYKNNYRNTHNTKGFSNLLIFDIDNDKDKPNISLEESKKFEERVYLFLDEFVRFGKLPFLLEMPALSRSYGVVLIFITQSNALIEKYYGREDARIVNSTVAYKIIFKMDDLEYAKQVSEEVGKMTRKTRSHSTEKGQLITGGTSSIGKEAWDLLSAQDIMNIDKDEVIVLVSGHKAKPLKLKANYYFKNKELLSRINWEVKPNEEVF